MYQNGIYICIFRCNKICWFMAKKSHVRRNQGVCHVIHRFLDLLLVRYNCAKFYHCRICVRDSRERRGGCFFCPTPSRPWTAQKRPILNRVKGGWYVLTISLIWVSSIEHFNRLHNEMVFNVFRVYK